MLKKLFLFALLGLFASCLASSPAAAQATRTWVSGVGDDANPCSRTAPCKTFAGAISKTAPNGEIDCLDPGGFGAVTITKPITIDCSGTFGSTLVSGTNGIIVAAGANDKVVLRGISINGLSTGLSGVLFNSGAQLSIINCKISGFTSSAVTTNTSNIGQLDITDSYLTNSQNGVSLVTSAARILVTINKTSIVDIVNIGLTSSGAQGIAVTVTNSRIINAATGIFAGGAGTSIAIDGSSVVGTNTAMNAAASGSIIRASNNTIYGNSTNFSFVAGGTVASTGNNRVTASGPAPNGTVTQQ
jgi:hypothetical protein